MFVYFTPSRCFHVYSLPAIVAQPVLSELVVQSHYFYIIINTDKRDEYVQQRRKWGNEAWLGWTTV